MFTTFQSVEI